MSVAKDNWYLSGPLGIDTLTPRSPLAIRAKDASGELISFEDPNGNTKWHINQNLDGNLPGLNFVETDVALGRLFIGAGGNIGIGTIEPKANLHVSGGAIINQIGIGIGPLQVDGVGVAYETIGTIHPHHNLRLHSSNSILLHCGNTTASFDNAGSMNLAGNLTVGARSNGRIKVRHIDGKHHQNDDDDALHLNWNTGKPVHIGSKDKTSDLTVHGDIHWTNDCSPTGYVRLGNLQICWGSGTHETNILQSDQAVKFPSKYPNSPTVIVGIDDPGPDYGEFNVAVGAYQVNGTEFKALFKRAHKDKKIKLTYYWIAIGSIA